MLKSKPPARSTAARGLRLRSCFASALAAALGFGNAAPLFAKSPPIKVLVRATVSDEAGSTMPQAIWTKFVEAYVRSNVVPYDGTSDPTAADCRAAGADYLLIAPFELRPRLPGMPNDSGRVAAHTHLRGINCITGAVVLDQNVNFDSDPPQNGSEGDFESAPELAWARDVPAMLAKYPLVFDRVAHITHISPPFAFVDLKSSSHVSVGDALRDFATPDRANRVHPIILTVTQVFDKYVEVTFSVISGDQPGSGDLVEALPKGSIPTPAPAPASS